MPQIATSSELGIFAAFYGSLTIIVRPILLLRIIIPHFEDPERIPGRPDKERKFTMTIKAPSPVSLRELNEEDLFSRVPEFKSHGVSNRSLSYGFD